MAIDGTKLKANASRHRAMSYERMQQAQAELKAQIDELLERAKTTDALEADEAVKHNTGQTPQQALADAGYRSEQNFEALANSPTELVVAMGREGKRCAEIDAKSNPHTAAMAAKLQTPEGTSAYRKRKWIAEPPNGWIKSVLGFRQLSLQGLHRAGAQFKLSCGLALNLRRMSALMAA